MSPYALVLFVIVGVLILKLQERMNEPGCVLCRGKRAHHPTCPRAKD